MSSSRKYPERPILAVGAVIVSLDREILIVRRASEPAKGLWSLPGGAIKLGETVELALRREVKEECGIEVEIEELLGAFDRIFRDEEGRVEYHYVILDYICRAESKDIKPGSDADDYYWLKKNDIDRFSYTKGVKELLINLFERRVLEY